MSAETAMAHRPTMAEQSDIHDLYENSVQNVEHEVEFLQTTFQQIRGRKAYLFREDFCGTASASCEWVKQGEKYQAIGVDIDPAVLDWGRNNRLSRLPAADQTEMSCPEQGRCKPVGEGPLSFRYQGLWHSLGRPGWHQNSDHRAQCYRPEGSALLPA